MLAVISPCAWEWHLVLISRPASFLNYENSAGRGTDGLPLSKRQTMKRTYWYIDYHDFMLVVKYRLAVMRSRIEASMVKVRAQELRVESWSRGDLES